MFFFIEYFFRADPDQLVNGKITCDSKVSENVNYPGYNIYRACKEKPWVKKVKDRRK